MFDIRVFNALATQTSIKIGQISFNVTTPTGVEFLESAVRDAGIGELLEGGEDEIADHPDKRQTPHEALAAALPPN
jgi:hypothetical protein